MADDENGTRPASGPTASADHHPAEASTSTDAGTEPRPDAAPGAETMGPPRAAGTVWTASDRRGPLNAADESDIERMVPGSETDAVGTEDVRPRDTIEPADGATSVEPPRATSRPDAPVPAGETRRSRLPIAAGLVIGAIIGAGSAAVVYGYYGTGSGETDGRIAALIGRVDALEKRQTASPDDAGLKGQVAALEGKIATLDKSMAEIKTAPAAKGTDATAGGGGGGQGKSGADGAGADQAAASIAKAQPAFDPAPLQAKIATLQGGIDALRKETSGLKQQNAAMDGQLSAAKDLQGKVGGLATALAGVEKQAAASQAGLDAVRTDQKALADKVGAPAIAVVADSLVQQIDNGRPYATQVEAAASLGADPAKVAVLRESAGQGVPSAKALAAQFAPLVDPIVATETHAPEGAGFLARLESGAKSLVSIRSADAPTGTDLRSRVARIQADLTHDDLGEALKAWTALPDAAKAKSQAWGALLKTSVEAKTAAHDLQRDAIAALAAKRS